jgi:hypothetical protein
MYHHSTSMYWSSQIWNSELFKLLSVSGSGHVGGVRRYQSLCRLYRYIRYSTISVHSKVSTSMTINVTDHLLDGVKYGRSVDRICKLVIRVNMRAKSSMHH